MTLHRETLLEELLKAAEDYEATVDRAEEQRGAPKSKKPQDSGMGIPAPHHQRESAAAGGQASESIGKSSHQLLEASASDSRLDATKVQAPLTDNALASGETGAQSDSHLNAALIREIKSGTRRP